VTAPLVLLAEDDPRQAEVVRRYLVADGYAVTVVHDGVNAVHQARAHRPDLVVLDVMMPGLDGLEVCGVLREQSDVPILLLTARTSEDDLLAGLDGGADDYLTKPYSPRELTARIRTLLRRTATAQAPRRGPVLRVGPLVVAPEESLVMLDGVEVDCTRAELALLVAMAAQPGRVFSRAQLLAHTRGVDRSSTERAIDVHVVNLRRKIEADPPRPRLLRTVRGMGYRLGGDAG
jgi:two-component system, OmpR family, response regulator MtrA